MLPPLYSVLDPVLVDVRGSVDDGMSVEGGSKVRIMHPDFRAVVYLHLGGPVGDDTIPSST